MEYLASIILFGLPFVVLPFGSSWYEIPKVLLSLIAIALLAATFFWRGGTWKRVYFLHLGIIGLSLYSLIAQWTPTTFFGNPFRLQGILTLWALLIWSVVSSQLKRPRKLALLSWVVLIATLIIALIGRTDSAGRAVGSIGEANALGAFTLFILPLTSSIWAAMPALVTIFISGSRSALIGLCVSLGIWLGAKKFSHTLLVLTACCCLLATLFLPFLDTKQDFDFRADIWRTAIEAGKEKTLTGWGIGNTEVGLKAAAEHTQTFLRYQYVDSSHNVFLDWWVQGGIIGLILFTTLLGFSITGLIIHKETALLASLFGVLAVMLFNPVSIAVLVSFWWIIGQGLRSSPQYAIVRKTWAKSPHTKTSKK